MRRTSSEPLREQQRGEQVHRQEDGEHQTDDVLGVHGATTASSPSVATAASSSSGPMIRSHPHTNPTHSPRNASTVRTTNTSAMWPSYRCNEGPRRGLTRS